MSYLTPGRRFNFTTPNLSVLDNAPSVIRHAAIENEKNIAPSRGIVNGILLSAAFWTAASVGTWYGARPAYHLFKDVARNAIYQVNTSLPKAADCLPQKLAAVRAFLPKARL